MIGHYQLFIQTEIGLWYNLTILVIFAAYAVLKFFQRIPAVSGKHCTLGRVTWSEYGVFAGDLDMFHEALISYSYHAADRYYPDNLIRTYFWNKKEKAREFPRGKGVKVYFSPRDPGYSKVGSPPAKLEVLVSVLSYVMIPFVALNGIATFIFYLVSQAG